MALVAWRLAWHNYVGLYTIIVCYSYVDGAWVDLLRVGLDGDAYLQKIDLAGAYARAWRNGRTLYALSWRNTDCYSETMDICLQDHANFLPKSFTHIIYVTRMFNS